MAARQVVLPTPPKSFHPCQLLSRQYIAPVNPLAATLMDLPASVANKRLTAGLTPLDATLTKNRGAEAPPFDVSTFSTHDSGADKGQNALPSAGQIRPVDPNEASEHFR
jgi:hypothetical protein